MRVAGGQWCNDITNEWYLTNTRKAFQVDPVQLQMSYNTKLCNCWKYALDCLAAYEEWRGTVSANSSVFEDDIEENDDWIID